MEFFLATGDWILALGKTIIHSIWVGLLILSLLKLSLNFIPERYSNLRYRISVLSLLLLLGSVIAMFFLLYSPAETTQVNSDAGGDKLLFLQVLNAYMMKAESPGYHLIYLISSYIYIAGIPVVLIRSMGLFRYQFRMKKAGSPVRGHWKTRFLRLKISLGIKRSVELMESGIISAPVLLGFFKPVVLVPAGMLSNLSVSQVETILMHELYHLRRFDAFANMIQLFIENVFFYNPAVWAISGHIRTEREKCCDDGVLESCSDPLSYAQALFQIAGQNSQFTHLTPGAGGTDKFQLLLRIQRILKIDTMKNNFREKIFSLVLLLGGLVIMLTVTGFTSAFSILKNHDSRQVPTVNHARENPLAPATVLAPVATAFDTVPEIDRDEIREEIEKAKIEIEMAMEEIDWEEIKLEMEEAKLEAKKAMEEIDWEEIKKEMKDVQLQLDSVLQDIDVSFDDLDVDVDMDFDFEDLDVDFDFADLDVIVDVNFDDLDVDMDFEINDLEMATDSVSSPEVF